MSFSIRLGMRTLMTAAALSALSSPLLAQGECAADADCEKGFTCEVTGGSACAGAAAAPCAPGTDCAVPPPPDCEPMEYKSCLPGPCTTDSDCASGMVCHTQVVETCIAPPCPDGFACAAVLECTSEETASCVPKWTLACESAADCGAGFECAPQELCSCSGGMVVGVPTPAVTAAAPVGMGVSPDSVAPDAGAASNVGEDAVPTLPPPTELTMPEPYECTCKPSDVSACKVIETECTTNADCPAEWTCEAEPQVMCAATSSGSGGAAMGGGGMSAPEPSEPEAELPLDLVLPAPGDAGAGAQVPMRRLAPIDGGVSPCGDVVARSLCQPPHRELYVATMSNGGMPEATTVMGPGGNVPGATPSAAPIVPTTPPAGTGEVKPSVGPTTGETPAKGTSAAETAPAPSVSDMTNPVSHNAAVEEAEADGAGCAVAQGPARHASSSGLWLVAAGLGALFSRRRNARG
jgi:hypothetical protein